MDLDAYELILEVLSQSHDYGESIADKIELWIGTSFGLIIMAYFAPDRLRPGTATIVISIYVAFTAWIFSNIGADIELGEAALEDAKALAEQYQIDSKALQYRLALVTLDTPLAKRFSAVSKIALDRYGRSACLLSSVKRTS